MTESRYRSVEQPPGGARITSGHEGIEIAEVANILLSYKWIICIGVVICGIAAAVAATYLPKAYEASVLLSPVTQQTGANRLGSLGGLASELGGLGSLVGLSVSGNEEKSVSIATLQSDALTSEYIEQNNLLRILFKKQWNSAARSWNTTDKEKLPTIWKANQLFKKRIRKVAENSKTGLVSLTVSWSDPVLAAKWANDLVRLANDYLRDKAISESEKNIAYLRDEVSKTTVLQLQQALYSLMESEIKTEMIARGTEEYALRVVDPATVPEKPSSPNRMLWTVLGAMGGGVLSVFAVFTRLWIQGRKSAA